MALAMGIHKKVAFDLCNACDRLFRKTVRVKSFDIFFATILTQRCNRVERRSASLWKGMARCFTPPYWHTKKASKIQQKLKISCPGWAHQPASPLQAGLQGDGIRLQGQSTQDVCSGRKSWWHLYNLWTKKKSAHRDETLNNLNKR